MKVTGFGTTMLMFDDGRDQLLFDCHVTRPSLCRYLFGKLRTDEALVDQLIAQHRMDRLRAIFISHAHHDHVMDAPAFALRCGAGIYGSASALNVARGGHVPEERLHDLEEATDLGLFRVEALSSVHSRPTPFNNDLGRIIDRPLVQPARGRDYREGGSWDFAVTHPQGRFIIRPSFNFIPGQLDGRRADVLFLGINGLSRASSAFRAQFFAETVEKLVPRLVIPIHWDNFFAPLTGPARGMPRWIEDSGKSIQMLAEYCRLHNIDCIVQPPLSALHV